MFASLHLQLRSETALEETCDAFDAFLARTPSLRRLFFPVPVPAVAGDPFDSDELENMAERALTTPDLQNYQSTASAPSLRSRQPAEAMQRPQSSDGDAGNVKVVVRVRKFIKRGRICRTYT
ncbi:hypothetical protein BBD39_06195 [Arsenophonus endosymbiont of Bemisia tabaci Asia II 3]|nr:hypothetical protein BBD39_06195 [Arsenophonus endosymbiont of Bemisia tabaci Asia II 3]